jgi:hypothetical protein
MAEKQMWDRLIILCRHEAHDPDRIPVGAYFHTVIVSQKYSQLGIAIYLPCFTLSIMGYLFATKEWIK